MSVVRPALARTFLGRNLWVEQVGQETFVPCLSSLPTTPTQRRWVTRYGALNSLTWSLRQKRKWWINDTHGHRGVYAGNAPEASCCNMPLRCSKAMKLKGEWKRQTTHPDISIRGGLSSDLPEGRESQPLRSCKCGRATTHQNISRFSEADSDTFSSCGG